jgi:hypothetical protein
MLRPCARRRCVSLAAVLFDRWLQHTEKRTGILKPWGDWSRKDSAQRGRPAVPDHWTGRPGGSGAQPPLHLIYMVKVDDTVVIGDPQVPPLSERRAAFASFAAKEGRAHAESWKVIECVFLRTETKYLGLVGQPGLDHAWIIGNDLAPIKVEFPQALASRRIAFGIGKALQTGKLV